MTRGRQLALRFRRLILVLGILFVISSLCWLVGPFFSNALFDEFAALGLIGTPLAFGKMVESEWTYAATIVLFLGLLLLAQWAFLCPGRVLTAGLAAKGRPLRSAVVAAAAMAMLLSVGAIALVLEIPDWWEPAGMSDNDWAIAEVWTAMLLLWVLWACIFFVYWRRGDRYTQLGRMIRGLVAGSLIEALVAVPVHIWATNQHGCYCARGTYTTLVLAGTVLLWAFGPGIVLLYMHERYRRARLFPMCSNCGYNLRGNESGVCPECGTAVDPNVT